jgi:hypothetical protein
MAVEILAYVIQHPRAQDTFEGILEWWVLERCIERQRIEVEEAVEELVQRGLLLALSGPDRRTRYRLNPQRRADVDLLLARRPGRRPEEA